MLQDMAQIMALCISSIVLIYELRLIISRWNNGQRRVRIIAAFLTLWMSVFWAIDIFNLLPTLIISMSRIPAVCGLIVLVAVHACGDK